MDFYAFADCEMCGEAGHLLLEGGEALTLCDACELETRDDD
jgi:hypothetical protein